MSPLCSLLVSSRSFTGDTAVGVYLIPLMYLKKKKKTAAEEKMRHFGPNSPPNISEIDAFDNCVVHISKYTGSFPQHQGRFLQVSQNETNTNMLYFSGII